MTINNDIDNLKAEAKILTETLEIQTNHFSETMKQHKSILDQELQKLKEYNVMLQKVPKKIDNQIQEVVPKIAAELANINDQRMQEIKKRYEKDVHEYVNSLTIAQLKISELTENIKKIDKRRIINLFIGVIVSSCIAAAAATYGASYMIQSFPTRVVIDKPDKIILYDSSVSIWGDKSMKLPDNLRKNNKKNARKY
jgi:nitrate/nitrite-specific signal transduction histidine kinase